MPESGRPIRVYKEHDVRRVDSGEGETEDHNSREEPRPTQSFRPKSAPWSSVNDDLVAGEPLIERRRTPPSPGTPLIAQLLDPTDRRLGGNHRAAGPNVDKLSEASLLQVDGLGRSTTKQEGKE